jgi:tRNA dimethylallyltransferase
MSILTIVGPTATGKTDLAVKLAKRISGEIVSADSRQIYKYLDIGTAKPNARQRAATKFHLIDFVEPDQEYSCGQFARDAVSKIEEITTRKKMPIVCGGTGLYIRALFHPLDELPRSDKKIKRRMTERLNKHGLEYMYQRLMEVDPLWASRIERTDRQRILRGLEVYELTGKPLTQLLGKTADTRPFKPYYIGLNLPREKLYERIDQRFEKMIEQGLVQEAKTLLDRGFGPDTNALRTIGYKEVIAYLNGHLSLDEAIEKAKQRTRNYAKRQVTWFNKIPGLRWFDPNERGLTDHLINTLDVNLDI